MFYGISEEEYWRGDPNLVISYRELYKLKQQADNQYMWLQGMYIHEGVAIAIRNTFAKKGSKTIKYPSKPYELQQSKKNDVDLAKREREKAIRSLNAWKDAWDKRK